MRIKLSTLFLTLITIFTIAPAVYAVPIDATPLWQNDAGFSFEEGYVNFLLGNNQSRTNFSVSTPTTAKQQLNADKNTVTAGIAAGYGATYKRGYFGVEISTQPIPFSTTSDRTSSITDKITTYNIANLDFIPGYYFAQNFLTYGRIGVGANYYKFKEQTNSSTNVNDTAWAAGLRLGVGVDWRVAQHFGVGVDYIYSRYFSTNVSNTPSDININSQTNNLIAAHLRYYF
jgi:opacity protein-like surface antigen